MGVAVVEVKLVSPIALIFLILVIVLLLFLLSGGRTF